MKFLDTLRRGTRRNRGFTLLLAALVASIALSLGTSIYSIVSKEIALSSIGQDSQLAFYAADTAAECALYFDQRTDIHPNTFATSSADAHPNDADISCDGVAATQVNVASVNATTTTTFEIANLFATDPKNPTASGYCADVEVEKSVDPNTSAVTTLIIANGYSVDCNDIGTAQTALQRTVELED